MRFDSAPFTFNDAVYTGVPEGAVAMSRVVPQNSIELGTQPINRFSTLMIEERCSNFNSDSL
ncbi:MAG: hypothetical protein QG625_3057 [Cyanobacteriota bacterium erpe_2018_sw_39hr_WHONDRS-SW48-000098_B_bin.30]|nr:hypothetical protein [Cyanobacteriota bacterium erpe_2018_sw_39hr_WHONDRS-SW48-000098_B_bin.30]